MEHNLVFGFLQPSCLAFDWKSDGEPKRQCTVHEFNTYNDYNATANSVHVELGPCAKSKCYSVNSNFPQVTIIRH